MKTESKKCSENFHSKLLFWRNDRKSAFLQRSNIYHFVFRAHAEVLETTFRRNWDKRPDSKDFKNKINQILFQKLKLTINNYTLWELLIFSCSQCRIKFWFKAQQIIFEHNLVVNLISGDVFIKYKNCNKRNSWNLKMLAGMQ